MAERGYAPEYLTSLPTRGDSATRLASGTEVAALLSGAGGSHDFLHIRA